MTAGLLTAGLSWLLAAGFPQFTYPGPSGPYPVGTTRLFFVDMSREDPFAPTPHTPRELLTAVWYPAEVTTGGRPAPFWPADANASVAIGMPPFVFSHVALVRSYPTIDAPMAKAESRYPVIVFSHGFNASPWQNVPQMEELASHGFIVVSLGHTYDASMLIFPDGRVVRDNSHTRRPPMTRDAATKLAAVMSRLAVTKEPDSVRGVWREVLIAQREAGFFVVPSVPVWMADTRYLMDQLETINAGTDQGVIGPTKPFAGRMALDRLGVAGMSFGGSTAGSVCAVDPRCKAGINLDGWQLGNVIDDPVKAPFMYFTNGTNNGFPVYFATSADLYEVHVKHATHGNFTDMSLIMPLFTWLSRPNFAMLGEIDAPQMERIMTTYTLAFFQQYLQEKPQSILGAPAPAEMADVVFTARPAAPVVPPP